MDTKSTLDAVERTEEIRKAFNSPAAREFFNADTLNELLSEHLNGKDNSRKIWIVYMFLLWHKEYFRENQAAPRKSNKINQCENAR